MHTLPAVARLKAGWPRCRLSWLVNPEWAPLLAGNPDIDELIAFPRRDFRGATGWWRFTRWCRETIVGRKPDLAVDFQGLLRSALIGRCSRPSMFYGLTDAREGARWLYDRVAPVPAGVPHAVERYLALIGAVFRHAGVDEAAASNGDLAFPLPAGEPPEALSDLALNDFILLHPFSRGVGKSLTASQVRVFCERLAPRRVVLVGGRGGDLNELPDHTVNLLGRTSLPELIWTIRRASCVISVDSGPSHLAAALGKPLIAIHTWSDPRRVGPYRQDAWVWKSGRLLPMEQTVVQEETYFRQRPALLSMANIDSICGRAISLSSSCA